MVQKKKKLFSIYLFLMYPICSACMQNTKYSVLAKIYFIINPICKKRTRTLVVLMYYFCNIKNIPIFYDHI